MALFRIGDALTFACQYTASKAGKAALTPTCTVYGPSGTLVTAAATTEKGGGVYTYTLTGGSNVATGTYIAVFHTADTTVDAQDIPSRLDVAQWVGFSDAAISSRLATSGYTAPDNADALLAATNAAAAVTAANTAATQATLAYNAARSTTDPLTNAVAGYATGTAGAALARIGSAAVTVVSPVASGGAITLTRGDSYRTADGRALAFTFVGVPSLTGSTATLNVRLYAEAAVRVLPMIVTGATTATCDLTATTTIGMVAGSGVYQIVATLLDGNALTLATGGVLVLDNAH